MDSIEKVFADLKAKYPDLNGGLEELKLWLKPQIEV
jgi:hypothetical protein